MVQNLAELHSLVEFVRMGICYRHDPSGVLLLVDRHDVQAQTTAASRYRPKEHQAATLKRPLAEKSGDFSKSAMGRDETAWAGPDQV